MGFKFRFTFGAKNSDAFRIDETEYKFTASDGRQYLLTARNGDLLSQATSYHIQADGFSTDDEARIAGERLRRGLQVINALLDLGLSIPRDNRVTANVADSIKEKVKNEHSATVIDTVFGLNVFPDDGKHFEYVTHGRINVSPSDPYYAVKSLSAILGLGIKIDSKSEESLSLLNLATRENSPKTAFVITFLSLEPLVNRQKRKGESLELIEKFISDIRASGITDGEKRALIGSISNLKEESFGSALTRLAENLVEPPQILGKSVSEFLAECVSVRNKIAHRAELPPTIDLNNLTRELRKFVMMLIWTFNNNPPANFNIPASALQIPQGGLVVKVM